ncbi:MAG TPA: phosphatase PAP2 family protein, partial [Caulobacteraceae bacterium]|nr:phosphatase PAP2 family protein [Caulobacteraceae bacterium]
WPIQMVFNAPAQQSPLFDLAARSIDRFAMFQGVLLMSLAAGAFARCNGVERVRLVACLFGASFAAVISRLTQAMLPQNPRPLFDPAIDFRAPLGADHEMIADWSSFPSDHAALLMGIALAIFVLRPRLGLLAAAIAFVGGMARIYGGAHYMSDTIAGWLIAATVVFSIAALKPKLTPRLSQIAYERRGFLAMAGFFIAVEAAYLYDDIRQFLSGIAKHLL